MKKLKKLLVGLLALPAFLLVLLAFVKTPQLDKNKLSQVIYDENDEILSVFLTKNQQWCLPVDVSKSHKLKTAVLLYEDKYFYKHFGINPVSLVKAFWANLISGKKKLGASTITMQTATLLNPKKRSYYYKFIEVLQAIKLELFYTKSEILNMYFQLAPYGKNYVGVATACYKYFGCNPQKLSWAQSAALAVLPQNPNLFLNNKAKFVKKRNNLLKNLLKNKKIAKKQYQAAIKEDFTTNNYLFNKTATHFSFMLNSLKQKKVKSTLNKKIQNQVQNQCNLYSNILKSKNINNLCALVANTKTGEIKAWVGSQNFYQNQVNGVLANRSTGSLLKPFLYALAFDLEIITSQTLLADVPTSWGSFSPANSNQKYAGLVSAEQALIKSLNIPAADLLEKLGLDLFYNFLKTAGLKNLFRTAKEYGLSLVIGGAEANMLELAGMFRALGTNGEFSNLTYLKNQQNYTKQKLISPEASYITLNILKNLKRPGSEYYWNKFDSKNPIAWKTGTSFGNRDAWAIGVNPDWTIAVWVGNFDGASAPEIIGAKTAGPLMFNIFNALNHKSKWFNPPKNLVAVQVCAFSGLKPTKNCTKTKTVLMPSKASNLPFCANHKAYFVDENQNFSYCSKCWQNVKVAKKIYTIYKPKVQKHLLFNGANIVSPPKHNPNCSVFEKQNTISITYPNNKAKIMLPKNENNIRQKLTFRAANNNKSGNLYWFLNKKYLAKTNKFNELAVNLDEGDYSLYICDDFNNSDEIKFTVKYP